MRLICMSGFPAVVSLVAAYAKQFSKVPQRFNKPRLGTHQCPKEVLELMLKTGECHLHRCHREFS